MGDGAEWIWNVADQHFPGAIQIVIFIMPGNISGSWLANCTPMMKPNRNVG